MPDRRRKRPRDPAPARQADDRYCLSDGHKAYLEAVEGAFGSAMRCWSKYMSRLAKAKNATVPRDSLFQSRPVRPNRCTHGQTFEGAHSGRSPVQADAEGTAGHRKWAGYGGLRRRWSCCSCKDRSVKRTSIGQRGGRQEGQDQARHKIEIAPNLILNAPSARRSKTKEAGGAKSSQGRDRFGHCYSTPVLSQNCIRPGFAS